MINVTENIPSKVFAFAELSAINEQIEVYAGPGTDYLLIDTIEKRNIQRAVKIEGMWAEVEFHSKRGYVEADKVPELCTYDVPRVLYDVSQNIYPYPIVYNIKAEITLFDDATAYFLPESSGPFEVIPSGETITILYVEPSNIRSYAQIEFYRDGEKQRYYSSITDLLSLDNPLLNFDSVKSANALITYDDVDYYSSSGESSYWGWKKKDETIISKTEWNILSGITNVIASNDINDEALKTTEGKIQLYSFKHRQYINANVKNERQSNIIGIADFLLNSTISFISGANNTLILKIELHEYEDEHKIVIKTGNPIEFPYAGKTVYLSSSRVDKTIKSVYPNLDKNETYDLKITFSNDFRENNYGYYLVIDKNLKIYAMPIIHAGTSFCIYSKETFIYDATWDIALSMQQLDDESAKKILELLAENGFTIQDFTFESAGETAWAGEMDETEENKNAINNGGRFVKYKRNTYYWKMNPESVEQTGLLGGFNQVPDVKNELICRTEGGAETVILEDTGSGQIFICDDCIFYEKEYSSWGVCELDGTPITLYEGMDILDVDTEHKMIICRKTEGNILGITSEGDRIILAPEESIFLGIHGLNMYYGVRSEGMIEFFSIRIDGLDKQKIGEIYMSAPEFTTLNVGVGETLVTEDSIYFTCGTLGGTGLFFYGQGIYRIGYDGKIETIVDPTVAAVNFPKLYLKETEEESILYYYAGDGHSNAGSWDSWVSEDVYGVNVDDGTIQPESFVLSNIGDAIFMNGGLSTLLDESGEYTEILSAEEAAQLGYTDLGGHSVQGETFVRELDIVDDTAYFTITKITADYDLSVGWRTGYRRDVMRTYATESGSGKFELIDEY